MQNERRPDSLLSADAILIQGLEFYAYHGVPDAEREVGHRYRIDLRLSVDLTTSGDSDDVADTVDYALVADLVLQIGIQERFRLLEALAERISSAILTQFSAVRSIYLRVQKLLPPMNAIAEAVGVEITRTRAE